MDLPADLSEGWWWIRWADGMTTAERIVHFKAWLLASSGHPLDTAAHSITAMERVAGPRWERGDG